MAMVRCRKCKKGVLKNAKKCPHCGIKNPGVKITDKIFDNLILIIFIGLVLYLVTNFDSILKASISVI